MKRLFPSVTLVIALACSCGSLSTAHAKADAKTAGRKKVAPKEGAAPTPASLVNDMEKAVAFIAKSAAGSTPVVSVKSKEARPFWEGLKGVSEGLDAMSKGIKAKDGEMVKGLQDVGEGLTTLTTAWGVIHGGHKESHVGRGITALSESYMLYLHHYGPAVARFKKGGEVSQAEMDQVAKADEELEALEAKLEMLEGKCKHKSYQQRLLVDLRLLVKDLRAIKVSNVKTYCKFVYQWDRLEGALGSFNTVIDSWYPGFVSEWEVVETDTKAVEGMFVEDASYYEGWDYTTTSVSSYGVYYNKTESVSTITEEEETSYESSVESYSEESATEESSEESAEIDEEIEVSDDEDASLFEEVEMGENDGDEADDDVEADGDDDSDDDGVADDVEE